MTRGGVRKGAGRPPIKGEKRTAHLGGVHITPTQLEAYRQAAMRADLSITAWVETYLDAAALGRIEAMAKILRDYAFTDRVDFTNMREEARRALGE